LLWESADLVSVFVWAVLLLIAIFNRELASWLSTWEGISPWWTLLLIALVLFYGLLKAYYEEFLKAEDEGRDKEHEKLKPDVDRMKVLVALTKSRVEGQGLLANLSASNTDEVIGWDNKTRELIERALGREESYFYGDSSLSDFPFTAYSDEMDLRLNRLDNVLDRACTNSLSDGFDAQRDIDP
jgi:hypothetical protein